jgi:Transposase
MACRIKPPVGASGGIIASSSPGPRSRTGSRPGGKKAACRIDTEHLDWALKDFSGYIAADELYDGPFCILSIVDNRTFKRIAYQVLRRDPTQADVTSFFRRFQAASEQRGLTLRGITTDGSSLYPAPIAEVFGDVPHQLCTFHVLRELTKAVLGAVAKVRKDLASRMPELPRGRPTKAARRTARKKQRLGQKIGALFGHRYLFVQRTLSPSERKTLLRIARGLPQLRVLRSIMEEVYRLFDRRCRTETALARLAKLRRRVRRFRQVGQTLSKLFSPNLEKALTFLDDRLLPATSNAVERGSRRYRKMQARIYRVRTEAQIKGRLALDLLRESRARDRAEARGTLHRARAA